MGSLSYRVLWDPYYIEFHGILIKKGSMRSLSYKVLLGSLLKRVLWDPCYIRFYGILIKKGSMGSLLHWVLWDPCYIRFYGILIEKGSIGSLSYRVLWDPYKGLLLHFEWFRFLGPSLRVMLNRAPTQTAQM